MALPSLRSRVAALALLLGCATAGVQAHTTCTSQAQCLDAVLSAGGAGRQIESIMWMQPVAAWQPVKYVWTLE